MDFDWSDQPFDTNGALSPREIEESFEDPHGLRLFPDSARFAESSRAFCLGKTLNGHGVFSVFRADGKRVRVIAARPMTDEEEYFFQRKVSQWTS
jgi:uncharacterized DUF497 family protein